MSGDVEQTGPNHLGRTGAPTPILEGNGPRILRTTRPCRLFRRRVYPKPPWPGRGSVKLRPRVAE